MFVILIIKNNYELTSPTSQSNLISQNSLIADYIVAIVYLCLLSNCLFVMLITYIFGINLNYQYQFPISFPRKKAVLFFVFLPLHPRGAYPSFLILLVKLTISSSKVSNFFF